jgi:hypothetical protein
MNTAVVKIRRLISSNKAIAAGITSFAGAVGGAVVSWIGSGVFDATEIRLSAGGLVLALITAGATWLTSAGKAEIDTPQFDQSTQADPQPKQVVAEPV